MSMPFYVSPEQVLKDRADYARKNIGRGRPLIGVLFDGGVLLIGENSSRTLHKINEIYDRIAFAGVGKYTEFEQLRIQGVRHADLKGYQYSREDVDARSLANSYANFLGQAFTHEMKPLEVEILVAEVGASAADDQLYHITFDGLMIDEDRFTALGTETQPIEDRLDGSYQEGWSLADAVKGAAAALAGPDRTLLAVDLEAAVLDRANLRRAFRRIDDPELATLLA